MNSFGKAKQIETCKVVAQAIAVVVILPILAACGNTPSASSLRPTSQPSETPYAPVLNPADFVPVIDNPYFPLKPGTTMIYEGTKDGAKLHTEVSVTHETKMILGIACVVVKDNVFLDGQLEEAALDWFAQDKTGNVWYMGEDTKEYQNGAVTSTSGTFVGGVNGAQPGIIMRAYPKVGESYRQEYDKGNAEDMAEVVSLTGTASVPSGQFTNLLVTREWTPLEPSVSEHKYYASGVGWIRVTTNGSSDYEDLVKIMS